jgi:hypothetical protein
MTKFTVSVVDTECGQWSDQMTKLTTYLSQVKERLEKATPGPWYPLHNHGREIFYPDQVFGECGIGKAGETEAFIGQAYRTNETQNEKLAANLRLIASAPTDIARLVRICEVMRETLDNIASDNYFEFGDYGYQLVILAQETLAEVEKLAGGE